MATSRFNRSLVARLAPRPLRTPRVSVHSKLCVGRRPTFGDFAVAFCLAIGILISGCIVLLYIFRYLGSERSNFESIGDTDFCDVFDGSWVPDSSYPLYNSSECPFSERGFNCLANGRKDMDYLKWRWKPRQCDVPNFDAHDILERLRGKRVVFVGDSMSRTQWESLICMLMTGVQDPKTVYEVNGNQISKTIQFLGVHFQTFNLSIEFFRSVFLVQQSLPPRHWPKRVRTALKLDKMDNMNGKWVDSDVLIFNSGHWWTPSKLFDIGCYFQVGGALKLGMSINSAFRIALNTWASWIETKVNINRTHVFFRTYEPSHWSGSNQKVCNLTHQPLSEASENDRNEFADIIAEVVERMSVPATILNVTLMGAYRSDAHIGTWSYPPTVLDCSHWCLPGVPDAWNELGQHRQVQNKHRVVSHLKQVAGGSDSDPSLNCFLRRWAMNSCSPCDLLYIVFLFAFTKRSAGRDRTHAYFRVRAAARDVLAGRYLERGRLPRDRMKFPTETLETGA